MGLTPLNPVPGHPDQGQKEQDGGDCKGTLLQLPAGWEGASHDDMLMPGQRGCGSLRAACVVLLKERAGALIGLHEHEIGVSGRIQVQAGPSRSCFALKP